MKLKSILLSLCLPLMASADDLGLEPQQQIIGYTLTDKIDTNDAYFGEPAKYTLGAQLTADQLEAYVGCSVVGVRFAIGQDQGRTRVFVNNVQNKEIYDLAAKNVAAKAGWNNVIFAEPFEIQAGQNYFYGFDYTETAEMSAAGKGAICSVNSEQANSSLVLVNGELYPLSDLGTLCVQLIIDATNLTPVNLNLGLLDDGWKYRQLSERFNLFTSVVNNGRDPVTDFTIGYAFDDLDPIFKEYAQTVNPGQSLTVDDTFPYPMELGVGTHTFRVFIETIQGQTPPADGIKERSIRFALYDKSVQRRKVYLEVYSHQETPHAFLLNKAITTLPDPGKTMCHVQVYPAGSVLECNISEELHQRYAYTWPTFSTNRAKFPMEPAIAYDMNDYLTLMPTDMIHSIIGGIIDSDITRPAFADIDLAGEYDPQTRRLTIQTHIAPLANEVPAIFGNLALHLLVVENGVQAPQATINSMGATTTSKNYSHPNVLRHSVYGADGIKIAENAQTSTMEETIEIPSAWNDKNIRIVALLTQWFDPGQSVDLSDLDIINCTDIALKDLNASIVEIEAGSSRDRSYNLKGQQMRPTQKGLYLHRGQKIVK